MFSQLNRLFERFASVHLEVRLTSRPLNAPDGALVGYIEQYGLANGRFRVVGWAEAQHVHLQLGTGQTGAVPALEREDVQQARGGRRDVGFDLSVPAGPGTALLRLEIDGTMHEFELPPPDAGAISRARRQLRRTFIRRMLRLAPQIIWGMMRRDPGLRGHVRDALELVPVTISTELNGAVLRPAPQVLGDPEDLESDAVQAVTIILPVYNAFDLLPDVLDRVVRHTDLPWRLYLIEDKSTDVRVRPYLRDWVAGSMQDVTLLENDTNKGFIKSVNAGLAQASRHGDPVVLLNSDAFVPAGWASRLVAPLTEASDVATVTPMSNDAEIFSTPVLCTRTPLAAGQADVMDLAAQSLTKAEVTVDTPTGVGFCMAISPVFLKQIPLLDTVFNRGYGEEVDWCRKAAALGGRHVAIGTLFVEHRGGESFGSEEKQKLVQKNNAVISRRYPEYDGLVQNFIHRDPLLTARLALAMSFLDSHPDLDEVPVFVAHSMGGGAEMYLQNRLATEDTIGGVILRMGGRRRVQIEVITALGSVLGTTDDMVLLKDLLTLLTRRRIIYSCAVGDSDPVGLPELLIELAQVLDQETGHGSEQGDPLLRMDVLFHDFFPLSPSYTLLDSVGVYHGPSLGGHGDSAHDWRGADGKRVPLEVWQGNWGRMLARAERLIVFSQDSHDVVRDVYPAVVSRLKIIPHGLLADIPRISPPAGGSKVIGVLGNIGLQKGAAVLSALSKKIKGNPDLSLVVIGNVDPKFSFAGKVKVHGSYQRADIAGLVARYGITHWLIPSVWPETFSYTTHEALATGMPVLAFDFGAQGDAVLPAENGISLPAPIDQRAPEALAETILKHMDK